MSNYNFDADAFAQISAELKFMKDRFENMKEKIISYGEGELVGEFYTTVYKKTDPIKTFDKDLAKAKMEAFGLNQCQIDEIFNSVKINKSQDRITIRPTAISLMAAE